MGAKLKNSFLWQIYLHLAHLTVRVGARKPPVYVTQFSASEEKD